MANVMFIIDIITSYHYNVRQVYRKGVSRMGKEETKQITIRLPKDMWVKLRRLQEEEKIKSIHQACLDGLARTIKGGE